MLLHSNYEELIKIALKHQQNADNLHHHLEMLRAVLLGLPKANRYTLRFLIEHLHKISRNEVKYFTIVLNLV